MSNLIIDIPPKSWRDNSFENQNLNLYDFILQRYNKEDILAKVIKSDGTIKEINKGYLDLQVKSLVGKIIKLLNNSVRKQIKILGIIGSSEESLIFMLASAYLGAHHSICFEDLSHNALLARIKLFKPDIVIFPNNQSSKVEKLGNIEILNIKAKYQINVENLIEEFNENIKYTSLPNLYSEDSALFTLFTSGSTGLPKGVVHGVRSYINYAKFSTNYFFGANKDSIIFCATDAGWINGHTYAVYGPLSNGSQTILCENLNYLLENKNIFDLINKLKITCFYSSVTFLRLLKSRFDENKIDKNSLFPSLERIGSCGEPLAHEVGLWASEFFKPSRKAIVNTYFQTETGGILVAPRDEDGLPDDYSSVGKPREDLGLFIAKEKFSNEKLDAEKIDPNEIIISNYWEGIYKEIQSDREVNYFTSEGFYRLHDVGHFDNKGFLYIGGRSDDVINTAGHRISSAEIESICLSIKGVNEACAVSKNDNILGEKPIIFISLNKNKEYEFENIHKNIIDKIRQNLSVYHLPEEIILFDVLPKTKSGKIQRRIMREIISKLIIDQNKDYSTLSNKEKFFKIYFKFIKEKIDRYTSNSEIFSLNLFEEEFTNLFNIESTIKYFILIVIEKLYRLGAEFFAKDLFLNLELHNSEYIELSYKLNNKSSIKDIHDNFSDSSFKNALFFKDIRNGCFRIDLKNNKTIIIIFKSFNINDNTFKINIIFDNYENESIKIIRGQIYSLIDKLTNNPRQINTKREFFDILYKENNSNLGSINKDYFCFKCRANINELERDRGNEAFLLKVISNRNNERYICDLCLGGW